MNNKKVAAGLNGLLAPSPAQMNGQADAMQANRTYKATCFSLPTDVTEEMRFIAWFDRRKLNAVITEAFEQYAERWRKGHPEADAFRNK